MTSQSMIQYDCGMGILNLILYLITQQYTTQAI